MKRSKKATPEMLEPGRGIVFDPCWGSDGMFVQSDIFTHHKGEILFIDGRKLGALICRKLKQFGLRSNGFEVAICDLKFA